MQELKMTPACEGAPVEQKGGEAIELDARDSKIHGVRLVYEPQPKKLCVGYWINANDYPIWNYSVKTPGTYEVVMTQGCGKGSGGSKMVLETAGAKLPFVVKDTGGYQNWEDVPLGKVTFEKAGWQELTVKCAEQKAKGIMDIRRIVLQKVR